MELSVRNCLPSFLLPVSIEQMILVIRKCTFNSKRFKIPKLLISECQFDNHIFFIQTPEKKKNQSPPKTLNLLNCNIQQGKHSHSFSSPPPRDQNLSRGLPFGASFGMKIVKIRDIPTISNPALLFSYIQPSLSFSRTTKVHPCLTMDRYFVF